MKRAERLARARGWERVWTDASAVAVERAGRLTGVEIVHRRLEQIGSSPAMLDTVCFCDALEHCPEPRPALGEVHGILRSHGLLAVSMSNAQLEGTRCRYLGPELGHLLHFGLATLSQLVSDEGFRATVIEIEGFLNLSALTRSAPALAQPGAPPSVARRAADAFVGSAGLRENMVVFADRVS